MISADLKPNHAIESRDPIGNRQSAIGNRPVLRPRSVQIERELEVLSQIMDNQFRIPVLGWRFGRGDDDGGALRAGFRRTVSGAKDYSAAHGHKHRDLFPGGSASFYRGSV